MGRDGWLGIGWPKEYGGQGRSDLEQFIFTNEAWRAGVPIPFLTINTVGKTIMEFGSEEQKAKFLPKILAGELHFSIGYTEPGAGTDLASLRTTAVKDGDEWVINGQKVFTSLASYADYIWLAARTDPDAPKHKGITIFLVPTTDPGFSHTKIHTMVNAVDHVDLLQQRARRRRRRRRRREPRLGPHHQPAQLRAHVARASRDGRAHATKTSCATRKDTKLRRRPAGRSTRSGCRSTWPACSAKTEFLKLINWKVCTGQDQPGRRQLGQGVRHRVLHRGLPPAARGARPDGLAAAGARRRPRSRAASSGPCRAR